MKGGLNEWLMCPGTKCIFGTPDYARSGRLEYNYVNEEVKLVLDQVCKETGLKILSMN